MMLRSRTKRRNSSEDQHAHITTETLVTFAQLARSLPRRRNDRPIAVSTIHRWRHPGLRGVRLDAVRVGGAWHTTREAFGRFCGALTALETGGDVVVGAATSREGAHAAADDQLEQAGW